MPFSIGISFIGIIQLLRWSLCTRSENERDFFENKPASKYPWTKVVWV